jgi:hypothetical protein
MAGLVMEYEGWLPMNTFKFFGHLAVSVGKASPAADDEATAEPAARTDTPGSSSIRAFCSEQRSLTRM